MPTYIYMNDHIGKLAKPDPKQPVIRVQRGSKNSRPVFEEANKVAIYMGTIHVASVVFDPRKDISPSHEVKAWVEVYDLQVPKSFFTETVATHVLVPRQRRRK